MRHAFRFVGATLALIGVLAPHSATAAPSQTISGIATTTVTFQGTGLPALPTLCSPVTFTMSGGATGVEVTGGVGVELLTLSGRGGSGCEDVSFGAGTVTVTAVSQFFGWTTCGPLNGTYFRFGASVVLDVVGPCSIQGGPSVTTGVVVGGALVPSNVGGGVLAPITSASFAGAFVGQG